MEVFVLTFLLFLLSIFLMAWGVINGRAPIRGSCGGAAMEEDGVCKICRGDATQCPSDNEDG